MTKKKETKYTGIIALMKTMTPEQKAEMAKKASETRARKRAEKEGKIHIRTDIPIPAKHSGKPLQYPFLEDMPVGGCVLFAEEDVCKRVMIAAAGYGKKTGKKFVKRTLADPNSKERHGVWRKE